MAQYVGIIQTLPLPVGKTVPLLRVTTPEQNSWEIKFTLDADSVLLSLWVGSLGAGTLTATAYAVAEEGKEVEIISFPVINSPTTNLLLRKAAVALSNIRIMLVATGPVTLDLRARGISAGETSVRIESASDILTSQLTVSTTSLSLLGSALTDRNGVVVRNWGSLTLYLGETAVAANPTTGYPIGAGESMAIDIQAGQEIYGATALGSTDVRIMQAGVS